MIFILARDGLQAASIAGRFELTRDQWRPLEDVFDMDGHEKPVVICSDDWKKRNDSFEIAGMLRARDAEVWHR